MAVVARKEEYLRELQNHEIEVRNLVEAGHEQAQQGKTKDFSSVCDRLEKKYSDAILHN